MTPKDKFSIRSILERPVPPRESSSGTKSGWIDLAIQAFGCLVVVGWSASFQQPREILFARPGATSVRLNASFARFRREDVNKLLETAGRRAPELAGFVCIAELGANLDAATRNSAQSQQPIGIRIEMPSTEVVECKVPLFTLRHAIAQNVLEPIIRALDNLHVAAGSDRVGLSNLIRAISHPMLGHIDNAMTADGEHLAAIGWLQSADIGRIFAVDPDLALALHPLFTVHVPRDDVADHTAALGARTKTNRFGFVTTVPSSALADGARLCTIDGESVWVTNPLQVSPQRAPVMQVLSVLRGEIEKNGPNFTGEVELIAAGAMPAEAEAPRVESVYTFEPKGGDITLPPQVSIIVPFYADGFYLLDHLIAQGRAPSNVEWIFVCDDPNLSPSLVKNLTYRQTLVRQPTQLVLLKSNGGFAHANNIGMQYASAPLLLLMNSDIYCRDYEYIDFARRLFDTDPNLGMVGFSLQFEDGTVQHDGIEFRRAPWFGGLWASEHPRKGMPHGWKGISQARADAVTAALVMLRKSDFPDGQIFDPQYHIGDFEDVDLCMRMRSIGKGITLVRADGNFHLERQSLRHMGHSFGREVVTRMNCRLFNNRWQALLEQLASKTTVQQ